MRSLEAVKAKDSCSPPWAGEEICIGLDRVTVVQMHFEITPANQGPLGFKMAPASSGVSGVLKMSGNLSLLKPNGQLQKLHLLRP